MRFVYLILLVILVGCDRPNRKIRSANEGNLPEVSRTQKNTINRRQTPNIDRSSSSNLIKMKPMGGVYEIPIKINGVAMNFIFDTGASSISISSTEALFLIKQGKILEQDILGSVNFSDATGRISEGTMINLREVQIGNRTLNNVEASVVHTIDAPLLLGQSALAEFGKVTIDYKNNTLSFE